MLCGAVAAVAFGNGRMPLSNIRALIAAFALAVWSSAALALLPAKPVEKTCPFSGEKVEAFGLGSMLVTGGTFDMQPVMMGTMIVGPSPIAACADGFLFYKYDFTPAELERLKPLVSSGEFYALSGQSTHYRAAWLIEKMGGKPAEVVDQLLAASWEAKAPEDYARAATALLDRLPAAIAAEADPPKKEALLLLHGELLRRIGKFDEAQAYFEALEKEFTDGTQTGIVAKLELRLAAARDTKQHLIPREALEDARNSRDWLIARQPVLAENSRFKILNQFRTKSALGFFWDFASQAVVAEAIDGGPWHATVQIHSVVGGHSAESDPIPGLKSPLASLPSGRVLVSVVPRPDRWAGKLLELDPRTFATVSEIETPHWYSSEGAPVSHDKKLVFIDSEPNALLAYSPDDKTLQRVPGPEQSAFRVISADPHGPRVVIDVRKAAHLPKEGLSVWDYERGYELLHIPPASTSMWWSIVTALIDSRRNRLYVLIADTIDLTAGKCRLTIFDFETGNVVTSRESPGGTAGRALRADMVLSPDGRYLAVACGPRLAIFDPADLANPIETMYAPRSDEFTHAKFSPDGRYLAVEIDNVGTVLALRP
jgi:hypothetical protein